MGGKLYSPGVRLEKPRARSTLSFTNFNAVEGVSPLFDANNPRHLDVFGTLSFEMPDNEVEADPVKRRLYEPHGLTPEDIFDVI